MNWHNRKSTIGLQASGRGRQHGDSRHAGHRNRAGKTGRQHQPATVSAPPPRHPCSARRFSHQQPLAATQTLNLTAVDLCGVVMGHRYLSRDAAIASLAALDIPELEPHRNCEDGKRAGRPFPPSAFDTALMNLPGGARRSPAPRAPTPTPTHLPTRTQAATRGVTTW